MGAGDQPGHRHAKARPASIGTVGVTLSGTGGAGDWSTGAYSYYGVGNITAQLADGIKSETETFTYDRLSRLTGWTRAGVASESYGFDVFGNLINYNGRTLPVSGTTNRLSAAGYDASGNMTAWNGFSFSWDALDRMTALAGNGLNRRFAATADGERVVEREGSTYTFSLRGLDNRVLREMKATWTGAGWAWEWEKDSIWGAGRLLASVSRRDGIRHAHVDHLGSPRLLTNRCGQRVALLDHNPWGLDRPTGVQDGERHRFTAHQRDLGLLDRTWDDFDYMHARTYTPYLARFTSVDPGRDNDARVPQSWNLYAYVRNRPLFLVDPSGMAVTIIITRDTYTSDTVTGVIKVTSDVKDAGQFSGFTLETTKAGDKGDKNPIAPGTYDAFVRTDHSPNRIELKDVPNFTNIQLHTGNTKDDVKGCFAVGKERSENRVSSSKPAMEEILKIIENDKSGKITVTVVGAPKQPEPLPERPLGKKEAQ